MKIVQYTHTPNQLRDLLHRISLAMAYIPGVHIAQPPYNAPKNAVIGHGVTAHEDENCTVLTCFLCIDPALPRSLPEHCALVQTVVQAILPPRTERECIINVIITDILA
jgi:hypothetical protein